MEKLDQFGWAKSLSLAVVLGLANLKNLPMTVEAGILVSRSGMGRGAMVVDAAFRGRRIAWCRSPPCGSSSFSAPLGTSASGLEALALPPQRAGPHLFIRRNRRHVVV